MSGLSNSQRLFLIVITIVAWLAVACQIVLTTQLVVGQGLPIVHGIVKTMSYFTVLTNLLVAVVTTALLARGKQDSFLTRPSTTSASAVYIAVVGMIYSLLLRALWEPTGLQLVVDIALHDTIPILYVLFWLLFVTKGTLKWIAPVWWLIYPLVYVGWTVLRGWRTGDYPYHFADAAVLGYPTVFLNTALILAGFFGLGLIVVAIDHLIARRRTGIVA